MVTYQPCHCLRSKKQLFLSKYPQLQGESKKFAYFCRIIFKSLFRNSINVISQ